MAYIIKSGDTLSQIAKNNNTTVADIQAANPSITNPNRIYAGQTINIPGQGGASQAGAAPSTSKSGAAGAVTKAAKTAPVTNKAPDYSQYEYDASSDPAYMQAMTLLEQAQKNTPTYNDTWDGKLEEIYNQIVNREKFSYDLNADALYQQYKDQYTLQGKLAMMDTMGQAAAMTGGYGNSYAQSVGQQAYQGYLQQLNDVVPELYGMALDQYNQEGQDLYNQYGLYADREDQDYSRYRDTVSDYYTELDRLTEDARYQGEQDYGRYMDAYNIAYGQYRDQVSDWQAEVDRADTDYWNQYNRDYGQYSDDRSFSYGQYAEDRAYAYQQERDKKADEQWQAEFDEAKRQYDQQYALAAQESSGGSTDSNSNSETSSTGGDYTKNPGYSKSEIESIQRQAGIAVDGIWGPDTAKAYDEGTRPEEGGGGDPTLSAAGEEFMTKLPYAHAGSDISAWKKLVDQRLEAAYNSGDLSESDVTIILKRLGLE